MAKNDDLARIKGSIAGAGVESGERDFGGDEQSPGNQQVADREQEPHVR